MNIYVGNLSDDVSEENLRQAFESFDQGYIQNLFNTIS
jgi:RNA recognition motif-containing protein